MGLFSNKKKLCPICDSPTPRLFPMVVDGMPICKECKKKVNLPDGMLDGMPLDDFRRYMAYHQENKALRDTFVEGFNWNFLIYLDMTNRLFRLSSSGEGLVLEASCLKAFRILEDDRVLFESSPEGLRRYASDIAARAEALSPLIAQFNVQLEQYRQIERMNEMIKNNPESKNTASSVPYMNRPYFEHQLIYNFKLELTMEHPYWGGEHFWLGAAPDLDNTYPNITDFMRKYDRDTEALHTMAVHLMDLISPGAPELPIAPAAPAGGAAAPVNDPVEEIRKYKALLDSGVITEEEFSSKKRQIMGI